MYSLPRIQGQNYFRQFSESIFNLTIREYQAEVPISSSDVTGSGNKSITLVSSQLTEAIDCVDQEHQESGNRLLLPSPVSRSNRAQSSAWRVSTVSSEALEACKFRCTSSTSVRGSTWAW